MSRLRLAWIQIRSQIGQLAVAIIVIALGVALSAGMLLANAALKESFKESIDALAGRADLVVSPLSGGTMDESLLEKVREVEGVEAAAPLLLGDGFLEGREPIRVRIVGVDMLDDATVRLYQATPAERAGIEDPLVFLSQPDSVIAPRRLLAEQELERGSVVEVQTSGGRRRLTVRGVLEGSGVAGAFGGDLLVMDLYSAQGALGLVARLTQIDIRVGRGRDVGEVANRLRQALPGHIGVALVSARRVELDRTVAGFQTMLNVIAGLGLLLGVIITANRLATVYQERLWEMGVLRGLGWSPRGLVAELLGEATLLSTLGVAGGLPLGLFFAQIIVAPVADTMALNFKQLGSLQVPAVHPDVPSLALAGLAGVTSGTLAAWLPARRSARTTIASLKARRRRRDPLPIAGWVRRARFFAPILAAVALLAQVVTHSAAIGGVAMILLAAAGALLLQPGLRFVAVPIGAILGEVARVGARDQSRAPSRAIGAAAILLGGVALVVWIGSTGASFERFVVASLMAVRQADLVLDSRFNAQVGAVGENEPRLDEALLSELKSIPGVRLAGAEVSARSLEPETGILAEDPIRFEHEEFGRWLLQSGSHSAALERVANGEAVLGDSNLVANRGLRVGDMVRVNTPSGLLERPLAGVVGPSFQSPRGDVILSRLLYRDFWKDATVTRIYVIVSKGVHLDQIANEIRERVGSRYEVRLSSAGELSKWFADNVRSAFAFLDTMVVLTLLVVLIGAGDALAANVVERTREIGTLRALGYRPSAVARMVLAQALVIGFVGAGLGVAVGLGMSVAFVEGLLPSILGWQLEVYVIHATNIVAAGLGILACVLGGILPATHAARMPIIRAIRYE